LPVRCARFSDYNCFGHAVSSVCIVDPMRGRNGTCQPTDMPDKNGVVSCICF